MKIVRLGSLIPVMAMLMSTGAYADSAESQPTFVVAQISGMVQREEKLSSNGEETSTSIQPEVLSILDEKLYKEGITRYEVSKLTMPRASRFPAEFDRFSIDMGALTGGNRVGFDIKFYQSEQKINRLHGSVRLKLFADVLVASSSINRGDGNLSAHVQLEERAVSLPLNDFRTQIAQLDGMEAARRVSAGQPIRSAYIQRVTEVKVGEEVLIIADSGSIKITAKGMAKRSGAIGDVIPVLNTRSNKRIFARVTGSSKVQVVF